MKLFTRIKISYALFCVVPIFLIIVVALVIGKIGVTSISEQYDVAGSSMDIYFNPLQVLGNLTTSMKAELEAVMENDP